MLGVIVGDVVGNRFRGQTGPLPHDFKFWEEGTTFSADSVSAIAIADCLMDDTTEDADVIAPYMRKWIAQYPDRGFDPAFVKWGLNEEAVAYGASDHGCVARAVPVSWYKENAGDMARMAAGQAAISHNTQEAIDAAVAVAGVCFMANQGAGRKQVRDWVEERYGYDLRVRYADLAASPLPSDSSAKETARRGLICALWASSAEEAIRNAVSLGGETGATAAVAGGVAQSLYFLELVHQNQALDRLETPLESVAMLFRAQT